MSVFKMQSIDYRRDTRGCSRADGTRVVVVRVVVLARATTVCASFAGESGRAPARGAKGGQECIAAGGADRGRHASGHRGPLTAASAQTYGHDMPIGQNNREGASMTSRTISEALHEYEKVGRPGDGLRSATAKTRLGQRVAAACGAMLAPNVSQHDGARRVCQKVTPTTSAVTAAAGGPAGGPARGAAPRAARAVRRRRAAHAVRGHRPRWHPPALLPLLEAAGRRKGASQHAAPGSGSQVKR